MKQGKLSSFVVLVLALGSLGLLTAVPTGAVPIDVLTVDCTPFVSPGFTAFGPGQTMGMALQLVDPFNTLFNVTEVDPAAFQAMTAAQLAAFDLIAINNRRNRLDCGAGGPVGLGTTWHSVVGVAAGGRVVLTSHDAPRFHLIVGPGTVPWAAPAGCANCEPWGADELVRDAALWAGSGCQTGLLIFNDAWCFENAGMGWNNPELDLPPAWGISDVPELACIADGGHTDILPAFTLHPIYTNVNDARLAPNSISSFGANVGDNSFHSAFATYNAGIFTVTEEMINNGVVDPGGFNCCSFTPIDDIPDGTAITLIRDDDCPVPVEKASWGMIKNRYE
jgi:hypothetical protein